MLLADRPPTSLELSTGTSSKVGPGSYTPQDFKPRAVCTAPFRSTARRVEPTAWQSVGPAAYNVPTSLGQNMRGGQSSFRGSARMCNSTSKDQLSTPGPGSYHVPSSWDSFQTATRSAKQLSSTTFEWCRRSAVLAIRADRLQMNVVGPCSYSPQYGTTSKDRRSRCVDFSAYSGRDTGICGFLPPAPMPGVDGSASQDVSPCEYFVQPGDLGHYQNLRQYRPLPSANFSSSTRVQRSVQNPTPRPGQYETPKGVFDTKPIPNGLSLQRKFIARR